MQPYSQEAQLYESSEHRMLDETRQCFLLLVSRLVLYLVLGSNYSAETTWSQWGVINLRHLCRSTGPYVKPTKLLSSVARYHSQGSRPSYAGAPCPGLLIWVCSAWSQTQLSPGIETEMCLPLLRAGTLYVACVESLVSCKIWARGLTAIVQTCMSPKAMSKTLMCLCELCWAWGPSFKL